VRFVGPDEVAAGVLARYPEVLVSTGAPKDAGRVQAWVVGPGLGTGLDAVERLRGVLEADVPVLVDADALTLLKQMPATKLRGRTAPTLLTPHAGEAARLLEAELAGKRTAEAVEARRLTAVRELADTFGCTVLLKGSTTLVATPERSTVRVNLTGTPALATAGSGDVLSGLVGGLLATGLDAYDAASAGAWLHGSAGTAAQGRSAGAVVAGDLVAVLGMG